MPVYTIYVDTGEDYSTAAKSLDGNFKKVYPAGFEFDPESSDPAAPENTIRQPDRSYVQKTFARQGLRVVPDHLPKTVQLEGPRRDPGDLLISNSVPLVSQRFQAMVEGLEPGRHQVAPVELVWTDGSHAGSFCWFYPCARVDSMDREKTTHDLHRGRYWKRTPGGVFVVSLARVGAHHVWIDPRVLAFDLPFVSAEFRGAALEAKLSGIGYHELPAV